MHFLLLGWIMMLSVSGSVYDYKPMTIDGKTSQLSQYKGKVMIKTEIKQKIMACADELVASGINEPTNDQVRERLGGGSLSHISPVMREWRGNRKDAVVVALDMPTELKNVVDYNQAIYFYEQLYDIYDKNSVLLKINNISNE